MQNEELNLSLADILFEISSTGIVSDELINSFFVKMESDTKEQQNVYLGRLVYLVVGYFKSQTNVEDLHLRARSAFVKIDLASPIKIPVDFMTSYVETIQFIDTNDVEVSTKIRMMEECVSKRNQITSMLEYEISAYTILLNMYLNEPYSTTSLEKIRSTSAILKSLIQSRKDGN